MYYDARPCAMNGLFATDFVCDKLKGYYPFWMFNQLYKLGTAVGVEYTDRDLMCCAAKGDGKQAVMLTHYEDVDTAETKSVRLSLCSLGGRKEKLTYYVLDAEHDCTVFREETVSGDDVAVYLDLPLFTTVLVIAENVD